MKKKAKNTEESKVKEFTNRHVLANVTSLIRRYQAEVVGTKDDPELRDKLFDLNQGGPAYGEWFCEDCEQRWEGEPDQGLCDVCGLDNDKTNFIPLEYAEPMEYWVVTDRLADELEAQGEKVVRNVFGLIIWARCTSGRAVYLDSVLMNAFRKSLRRKY